MRDFGVLVLSDCVAAFGNEWDLHEASLRNLALFFAVISDAEELAEELRAHVPATA
jgi:isochorismate hydrolase